MIETQALGNIFLSDAIKGNGACATSCSNKEKLYINKVIFCIRDSWQIDQMLQHVQKNQITAYMTIKTLQCTEPDIIISVKVMFTQ